MRGFPCRRAGGLATIVGASLGIAIAPVLWLTWHEEWLVPWLDARVPIVGVAAEFVADAATYSSYGKLYCIVFLGAAAGFAVAYDAAIRRSQQDLPGSGLLFVLARPTGLLMSIVHIPRGTMLLANVA